MTCKIGFEIKFCIKQHFINSDCYSYAVISDQRLIVQLYNEAAYDFMAHLKLS